VPRYFFDIHARTVIHDKVGMNFRNIDDVKHEALSRVAEFSADVSNLYPGGVVVVDVRDEQHREVMIVRLVCQIDLKR
jgi:hypothetical protein